ncbi:MAG: hypothetical protein AB1767_13745 [Bacillota bacterium]
MINIPGYSRPELVRENQDTVIYRVQSAATGQTVLLKVINRGDPLAAVTGFSRELAIAGKLAVKGVCKPLQVAYAGETPVLVMQNPAGIPLREYIDRRRPD